MMISRGLFGWSPPHIQPLTPVSEVSEPPESPSPYTDMGTGEAEPVEMEEEMDAENEEMEPPPAAVPFSQLFACADQLDCARHRACCLLALYSCSGMTIAMSCSTGSLSAYREMGLDESKLIKKAAVLVGFSGESTTTVGEIDLPVYAK